MGNLSNEKIVENMNRIIEGFHFEKYHAAIQQLLS